MKTIKKILSLFLLCFLSLGIVSCGSFAKDSDEFLKIESFEVKEIDGENKLVISYVDEEKTDTIIAIPKGEEANGIASVTSTQSDDKKNTIITIKYTKEGIEDSVLIVPNGVSVEKIYYDTKDGITKMYVSYSNGKVDEFPIIKGEDGKDGVGIKKIEHSVNPDLSVAIKIVYDTNPETNYTLTIPAPQKGEDGKGIEAMGVEDKEDEYIINVTYTDGTNESFPLSKPEISTWHKVSGKPGDEFGRDGDFAFDESNKVIYSKTGGTWGDPIVDFSTTVVKHKVTFDLNDKNDGGPAAKMPSVNMPLSYTAIKGTYFSTTGNGNPKTIPLPTRDGYVFKGWYLEPYPTPVNAPFTDLTVIVDDLNLYAVWEKAE